MDNTTTNGHFHSKLKSGYPLNKPLTLLIGKFLPVRICIHLWKVIVTVFLRIDIVIRDPSHAIRPPMPNF